MASAQNRRPIELSTARCTSVRRAVSLLELAIVVSILGLLTSASISRYGFSTIRVGGGEGFVRNLSLALIHARRATIATGENHYLQLYYSGSQVSGYALFRRGAGGDVQVDSVRDVPEDVMVTSANSQLEFDFDGSSLAGYTIAISAEERSWLISLTTLTGAVVVTGAGS